MKLSNSTAKTFSLKCSIKIPVITSFFLLEIGLFPISKDTIAHIRVCRVSRRIKMHSVGKVSKHSSLACFLLPTAEYFMQKMNTKRRLQAMLRSSSLLIGHESLAILKYSRVTSTKGELLEAPAHQQQTSKLHFI